MDWPLPFYLGNRRCRERAMFAGETHVGDGNARKIEAAIAALTAEP